MENDPLIAALYDPALFGQAARTLMGELEAHLRGWQRTPHRGLAWRPPAALKERARALMDRGEALPWNPGAPGQGRVSELALEFLAACNRLHSPHYMGHQVAPPVPIAGLFDALAAVTNQASGIYEMGQLTNAAERAMADRLGVYLWPEGAKAPNGPSYDAIVTHGGSAANLTAILAARNVRYPGCWQQGVAAAAPGGLKPSVLCSSESHYSIARAAGIAGLGADQVLKAAVDSRRKLDASRVAARIDEARREGREVFCVVASSCATPTGAFDPIDELAAVCRERGIWLHVDAAHGGGVLLSRKHRGLLRGIERADSVTWDAHKMMFVPALCTFLFYRDRKHSFQAFDQDAPYLFAKEGNPTLEYDSAVRTLECTKRGLILPLWALWCLGGPALFERLVDRVFELTAELHGLLAAAPDFEPLHEPEANILCFRHLPAKLKGAAPEQVSEHQARVRKALTEGGEFYITATRLDGVMALRVTIMNPQTGRAHLEGLLEAIRRLG